MPRIPLVEPDHALPEVRALYESLSGDGLPVMNRMKLFGNNVDFLAALTRENRTHAPFRTDADDATRAQDRRRAVLSHRALSPPGRRSSLPFAQQFH
jgi:hypothetical protein